MFRKRTLKFFLALVARDATLFWARANKNNMVVLRSLCLPSQQNFPPQNTQYKSEINIFYYALQSVYTRLGTNQRKSHCQPLWNSPHPIFTGICSTCWCKQTAEKKRPWKKFRVHDLKALILLIVQDLRKRFCVLTVQRSSGAARGFEGRPPPLDKKK